MAVHPEDQWTTAFQNRFGVCNFVVMPFGLAGAPCTFQRLVQEILLEKLNEFTTVHLDDVLAFSRTCRDHMIHLRTRFEKQRRHQLYTKEEKRCLART